MKKCKNGAKRLWWNKKIALEYKEILRRFLFRNYETWNWWPTFCWWPNFKNFKRDRNKSCCHKWHTLFRTKDADAHEAFMCIAMNKLYDDPKRLRHSVHEFYLKSPEQVAKLYADIPEALEATQEIADKCNLTIKLGNPKPPNFKFTRQKLTELNLEIPEPNEEYSLENDKILFIHECRVGLEDRLKIVPLERHQEYRDRLEVEIEIINNMKFPGYMLIVWDFVIVAKIWVFQ